MTQRMPQSTSMTQCMPESTSMPGLESPTSMAGMPQSPTGMSWGWPHSMSISHSNGMTQSNGMFHRLCLTLPLSGLLSLPVPTSPSSCMASRRQRKAKFSFPSSRAMSSFKTSVMREALA
ncbi:hypothetical protein CMEL01_13843 [Colletotrichum melonis]|uniref:Uncharacterized protein n=1 Tax=Colletotrichum melonis TaxID=1209925 RepID=A0AAI9UTQ3_9PEZI|nr:hypothetical protein CMEL01_13843 [Colletotrichum melonis]